MLLIVTNDLNHTDEQRYKLHGTEKKNHQLPQAKGSKCEIIQMPLLTSRAKQKKNEEEEIFHLTEREITQSPYDLNC